MKVLGEEGTSLEDVMMYLKAEFLDHVYLQQNAFDEVDGTTPKDRQIYVFDVVIQVLTASLNLSTKDDARAIFQSLRQAFIDWNSKPWKSDEFAQAEERILRMLAEASTGAEGS